MAEEEPECGLCKAFCSILGGDTEECKKLMKEFENDNITKEELDAKLREKYGSSAVDLAKEEITGSYEKHKKLEEENND